MNWTRQKREPLAGMSLNVPSRAALRSADSRTQIWAVGGGKGGIGKTLLTTNMAVYLSWIHRKVVVVDLDLGGANLHTTLGVSEPTQTLSDLVLGHVEKIEEILQTTPVAGLQLISGAHDVVGIANLHHIQKSRLMRQFQQVQSDFVLFDLGAGTTYNTLDFFLFADRKIVVVTPEPTSVENAYRFIKAAYYRMLRAASTSPHVRGLIEAAMDLKNKRGIRTPRELLEEVVRLAPDEGEVLRRKMEKFNLCLIVNQVRVSNEAEIGRAIAQVCNRYFGIRVDYVGYLPYDNVVWQSIRRKAPFLIESPNSAVVTSLESILRNLLRLQP